MNKQKTYSDADLELAVDLIRKKELSYRQAESKFAIPRIDRLSQSLPFLVAPFTTMLLEKH